jgi:hypothetical protein
MVDFEVLSTDCMSFYSMDSGPIHSLRHSGQADHAIYVSLISKGVV